MTTMGNKINSLAPGKIEWNSRYLISTDMQTSFVIKWFRNIYTNKYASYSCIPVLYYEKIGMDFSVLRSSVVSKNFIGLEEIKSPFWKSALKFWLDFNKEEICNVTDVRDIANQPLWNNVYIQFKNRPLFFKNWINAGYVCVGDLFIEDSLVSLDYILTSLGPDSRLMFQYFALYNALPAAWRDPSIADYCTQGALQVVPSFCDIRINNLSAKLIRQKLTQQRKTNPCCVNFWGQNFVILWSMKMCLWMLFWPQRNLDYKYFNGNFT